MNMRKIMLLALVFAGCVFDTAGAKIRENALVSAYVYPSGGRWIPLVGFANASVMVRVQIPATGFDQTFRGTTDARGMVALGRFFLDPALSPTPVTYTVKASYVTPSNGLIQGILYEASFITSQTARVTTGGEYPLGVMIPMTPQ